MIFTLRILVKS